MEHITNQGLFEAECIKEVGYDKYERLSVALKGARKEAERWIATEDGGTCNFDSPVLDYKAAHMNRKKAEEVIKAAGFRSYTWEWYGKTIGLVLCGFTAGQGNRHTAMAEAACEYLKVAGVPAMMYYQMD